MRQGEFRSTVKRSLLPRWLLLSVGWLAVGLGILGIPLPVLPTTPFLLLAAACFLRSSPKAHQWLVQHPKLGPYFVQFLEGHGMPFKAKIYTLSIMWASMILSLVLVAAKVPFLYWLLPLIGLIVSIYLLRLPTLKLENAVSSSNQ